MKHVYTKDIVGWIDQKTSPTVLDAIFTSLRTRKDTPLPDGGRIQILLSTQTGRTTSLTYLNKERQPVFILRPTTDGYSLHADMSLIYPKGKDGYTALNLVFGIILLSTLFLLFCIAVGQCLSSYAGK